MNAADFADFDLIPLKPKKLDTRYKRFVAEHGDQCAELDAIPAPELRSRVKGTIVSHIDGERRRRLQQTERLERETLDHLAAGWQITPRPTSPACEIEQ